jgi:hypothetical protein
MNTTYSDTAPVARTAVVDPVGLSTNQLKRISWAAVFAGVIMAVVVQLVLSLLGAGIGMSTIDPLRFSSPDVSTFGMSAGIWWAVSSVIALYIGGWVAAHLSGTPEKTNAILHGLLTWGLATLVSVYLLTSAIGSIVRGGANVVGAAATATATGAAAAAGPLTDMAKQKLDESGVMSNGSLNNIGDQVKQLLAQTGKSELQPGALTQQATQAGNQLENTAQNAGQTAAPAGDQLQVVLKRIMESGKNTVDQVDRDAAVNVVMNQANISRPEAEQRVDGWIKTYQEAKVAFEEQKAKAEQKAREVADATAKATSRAALGSVVALLLGAIAAALGGAAARRKYIVATTRV